MWNVDNGRRTALGRLLRPYLLEEFAARYYEHEPLHVERSDESYYSPYFTLGDLEDVLYGAEIRSENCQASKRGIPARPESYAKYGSRAANRRRRLPFSAAIYRGAQIHEGAGQAHHE